MSNQSPADSMTSVPCSAPDHMANIDGWVYIDDRSFKLMLKKGERGTEQNAMYIGVG